MALLEREMVSRLFSFFLSVCFFFFKCGGRRDVTLHVAQWHWCSARALLDWGAMRIATEISIEWPTWHLHLKVPAAHSWGGCVLQRGLEWILSPAVCPVQGLWAGPHTALGSMREPSEFGTDVPSPKKSPPFQVEQPVWWEITELPFFIPQFLYIPAVFSSSCLVHVGPPHSPDRGCGLKPWESDCFPSWRICVQYLVNHSATQLCPLWGTTAGAKAWIPFPPQRKRKLNCVFPCCFWGTKEDWTA